MKRGEDGFTLVEVLVAFAVLSLILVGLYEAMAGAYRGYARMTAQAQAMQFAMGHLARIGIEEPLKTGRTAGRYSHRFGWTLIIEAVDIEAYRGKAFRVALEALDKAGRPVLTLETVKLAPRRPTE